MALLLVALFVLVPLALLLNDLVRGGEKTSSFAGVSHARSLGDDATLSRGPRPNWPRKVS